MTKITDHIQAANGKTIFSIEVIPPRAEALSTRRQLQILPKLFHLVIPDDLHRAVEACRNDQQVRQVGIEWCIQQCRELARQGATVLHFYTMEKADTIRKIAYTIF